MRLADVQLASKNKDGAAQSLRKSLELKPDLLDAQRGLILLNLDQKKYAEAVTIAQTVQKQRPKEPTGFVLEGDVAVAQKKWDVATEVYRAGLKSVPIVYATGNSPPWV